MARIFLVRRTRDNLSVTFGGRARRLGTHGLGTLEAISERDGKISIRNNEETERRGFDFWEVRNVSFFQWWTKEYNNERVLQARSRLADGVGGGHEVVVTKLNNILGHTIETESGDEGGSGLSSIGGTSVTSFTMRAVNYCLEDGSGFIVQEDGTTKFVSEDLNTVIQRSDGTFLSVDTRSVSHGGTGGSAGNPVVSGAVSGNTMTLTLDDTSTVDIDVTNLNNGTTVTFPAPQYQYVNTGGVVGSYTHDTENGPVYWGSQLKKGQELVFEISDLVDKHSFSLGIWSGGTSVTGEDIHDKTHWEKKIRFWMGSSDYTAAGVTVGGHAYGGTGFDQGRAYSSKSPGQSFALRYDTDNKLKLYDLSFGRETLVTSATTAEDGNPVTIAAAAQEHEDGTGVSGTLPPLTQRVYPWTLIHEHTAGDVANDDFRSGSTGTTPRNVFRYDSRKLNKGEKAKVTIPSGLAPALVSGENVHLAIDYTGSSLNQSNVWEQTTGSVELMHNGRMDEGVGMTVNTKAQLYYGSSTQTSDVSGRTISLRYNEDNSFDVFDELNEEVLFTKDTNLDGNSINIHMIVVGEVTDYNDLPWNFTYEINGGTWYVSDERYDPTDAHTNGINATSAAVPMRLWEDTGFVSSGRPSLPGNQDTIKFGKQIRPGQEIAWTQPAESLTRVRANGLKFGVYESGSWNFQVNFTQYSDLDESNFVGCVLAKGSIALNGTDGGGSNAGDTIILDGTDGSSSNAGDDLQLEEHTDVETAGKDLRLVYEYGTNKMHLDMVENGKRTRLVTGTTALDGNAKWLTQMGDDSYMLDGLSDPYWADWTLVHNQGVHDKPWNNWRVNHPAVNNSMHGEDVWRMRDGFGPGQKFIYTIASAVGTQYFIGQWKTSNAATGISNVEQAQNFDFGVRMGNDEAFWSSLSTGFTFNPNNPNYDSTEGNWDDPKAGSGVGSKVSFRYHTDNSMDIFDEDQGIIIATKDADLDGNPVKLSVALNAGISTSAIAVQFPGSGEIVDIDLGQELSTGTKWYQQFSVAGDANSGLGPQVANNTPTHTTGPWQWHKPLRAGEQLRWTHPGGIHIGKWSATGTYDTADNANRGYWEKVIDFDDTRVDFGNNTINTQGFDLPADYTIIQNTDELILRYDSADNKLKLLRKFTDYELLIMQANSAEDGQPIIISAGSNVSVDGLPPFAHELAPTNGFRIDSAGTPLVINKDSWFQYHGVAGTVDSRPGSIVSGTGDVTDNAYYYGRQLIKGEQLEFTMNPGGNEVWMGIWGEGSSSYTPSGGGDSSLWSKAIVLADATDGDGCCIKHGTGSYVTHGFDLARDYDLSQTNSTVAIRYDPNDSKLKVYNTTDDYEELICTANTAEDGNPINIASSVASGASLQTISHQDSEFNVVAEKNAGKQGSWRDNGTLIDTVLRHNRGLRPGFKYKTTTPTIWLAQFFSLDYTGTSTGQDNVENESASAIQVTSAEKLQLKTGWTINEQATRANNATETVSMADATISIRYHLDNSIDLYDEDNEQTLMTKNVDGNGSPVFLHILSSTNVGVAYLFDSWTIEPFAKDWYAPATNYNGLSPEASNSTAGATAWYNEQRARDQGGGSTTINNLTRVKWAEPFYPGQEFVWTADDTNNMFMGDRTADDTAWNRAFAIEYASSTATVSHTNVTNFDVASYFGSGFNATGKTMSLRYDYGDKKLKLYDITTAGAETLVGQSTTAVAGGVPIYLTLAGSSAKLLTATHRYYGWEFVHTEHGSLSKTMQADNWRINRPSVNNTLRAKVVLKHLRGLVPGQKMRWTTGNTFVTAKFGDWKSSNETSGINAPYSADVRWNWGWVSHTNEGFRTLHGMTFNTSATHYSSGQPEWRPGSNVNRLVSLRYHSNNSVDLYDEDNAEIIATKDVDLDGSIFKLAWASGLATSNINDNFFGGGDVTITSV